MRRSYVLWLFIFGILNPQAFGREQIGQLKVDNLVVRPQFQLLEPSNGQFKIGESLFSVKWEMDNNIAAVFTIGAKDLIGTTVHFTDTLSEELGFVEAYGEYRFDYGVIRAGLQPVQFGHEGTVMETDLDMPRSLAYQRRLLPLRDIGLSYFIQHEGYFTRLMLHNGESGANLDGRPWYTGTWGWTDQEFWKVGLSGQTGTTKPVSTQNSNDDLAGVDPLEEAQWRLGGPFVIWSPHNWKVALEGHVGEVTQLNVTKKYSQGYLLLSYTSREYFWGIRYDQFDPNMSVDSDRLSQIDLSFGILSERRTSRIFLVLSKKFEEGHQIPNDELRLVWHLTPVLPSNTPEM